MKLNNNQIEAVKQILKTYGIGILKNFFQPMNTFVYVTISTSQMIGELEITTDGNIFIRNSNDKFIF